MMMMLMMLLLMMMMMQVVRALWWSVSSELQESAHKAVATALLDTIHGQDVRA